MQTQISPLEHVRSFIPTLAQWHDQTWRHLNDADYDLMARILDYEQTAQCAGLPVMFVAHQRDTVMGSARLVINDMDSHPELTPWLASLYVHEPYRRCGIATRLIATIEQAARENAYEYLYLFTEDQQTLYRCLGWEIHSTERYLDTPVTIMRKAL